MKQGPLKDVAESSIEFRTFPTRLSDGTAIVLPIVVLDWRCDSAVKKSWCWGKKKEKHKHVTN